MTMEYALELAIGYLKTLQPSSDEPSYIKFMSMLSTLEKIRKELL